MSRSAAHSDTGWTYRKRTATPAPSPASPIGCAMKLPCPFESPSRLKLDLISTCDRRTIRNVTGNIVQLDTCRYEVVKLALAFADPPRALPHADKQDGHPHSTALANDSSHCFSLTCSNVSPTKLYRATVAGIAALFTPACPLATISLPGTHCDCSDKYPGLYAFASFFGSVYAIRH